ncbi:hypothetical protein A3D09_04175 [Candidatus Collierbacteria bacterium RIFCSPHIGHO2_02_FULL_49_10]|uniref:Uncharacterized protein n=1 Tax=Candidatus Collierbacteria bacterium RIFCSPHIGHO2_02_FULL_49_10 TaxID=1817723 RepID=A0A1F5ETK9_9BACT|nr:MAG: hypothetical protein A3D09_04175 [Candidatus Collierbacteria bacterium RIFCSPHIGHO2_02_FULL_49_10]
MKLRSSKKITRNDLAKLAHFAGKDREDLFARKPYLSKLSSKIICVALCQGAALHYHNGKNGVKDFDVWTFYKAGKIIFPVRRVGKGDFGKSKFGQDPFERSKYKGRRIDFVGRSISYPKGVFDTVRIIQNYLTAGKTASAQKLAKKAVVIISPSSLCGVVAWPRK